jgi:23S rRNA pseudouridine1911/1915/1917 synthase
MTDFKTYSGSVAGDHQQIRLDRYVSECLRLLSRSQIKNRVVQARLNGKAVKLSRLVKAGDMLELSWLPGVEERLEPEAIPLDILYEDARVVVLNKKQGMVVHPGAGNHNGTLANALLFRRKMLRPGCGGDAPAGEEGLRTGIVHRLDKDTSGVLIAAYDDEALAFLADQFKSRKARKRYLALVQGTPPQETGTIDEPLFRDPRDRKKFSAPPLLAEWRSPAARQNAAVRSPGKNALTLYKVLKSWGGYSLLLIKPKTGRTHQIRVHLKCLGTPVLGDPLYGKADRRFKDAALMLHARSLELTLPGRGEASRFKAPVPERMKVIIRTLNSLYEERS